MNCFVCGGQANLHSFDEESFRKCKMIFKFWQFKKFKYSDIDLPAHKEESAYHISCKKTFSVIKQKYRNEFNEFQKSIVSRIINQTN